MAHHVWSQPDTFTHGALALDTCRWRQLDLFMHGALALDTLGSSCRRNWMNDHERDRRSGGQWLRAVQAYLEFGAGDAWRRLSDPEQRNSPERDWYLGGLRTMNGIPPRDLTQDGRGGAANLPAGVGSKAAAAPRVLSSPVAKLVAAKSRGWIVAELLRVNPLLSDKKLLLHLSHLKLAGMLIEARSRKRGVSSGERPAGKKEGRGIVPEQPKKGALPQSVPTALRRSA